MGKLQVGMRVRYNEKLLDRCERFKDTETRLKAEKERGTLVKLWGGRNSDIVALVDWDIRGKDSSLSTYLEEDEDQTEEEEVTCDRCKRETDDPYCCARCGRTMCGDCSETTKFANPIRIVRVCREGCRDESDEHTQALGCIEDYR